MSTSVFCGRFCPGSLQVMAAQGGLSVYLNKRSYTRQFGCDVTVSKGRLQGRRVYNHCLSPSPAPPTINLQAEAEVSHSLKLTHKYLNGLAFMVEDTNPPFVDDALPSNLVFVFFGIMYIGGSFSFMWVPLVYFVINTSVCLLTWFARLRGITWSQAIFYFRNYRSDTWLHKLLVSIKFFS